MPTILQIFLIVYLLFAASLVSASAQMPLKDWEIAGFVAALKNPDDDVVRAALEYPRAREILETDIKLESSDIKRVAGILLEEFEKKDVIPLLIVDSRIAASAQEEISKRLSSSGAEVRKRSIQYLLKKPNLGQVHTEALTNRLSDKDNSVREAAYALLEKQPQLFNLAPNELTEWLTDEENWKKRRDALRFIAQKPGLVKPEHTEALTNRLGDNDISVREAAYALLEKQPQLFNLAPNELTEWLTDDRNNEKQQGALKLIAQKPELVKPEHTETLTNRLGDNDISVSKAAYALLEKQPQLFNLAPNELTEWLTDDRNNEKQQGALKLIAQKPELFKPEHTESLTETLTNRLGDNDISVSEAAYALLEKQPQLFNLAPNELTEWLTDEENWEKRRAALRRIAQKPELVKPEHTKALTNRLGDENYNIREAAYALLEKQPQLFNLAPNELTEWLTDEENWEKQQGALKLIAQKPELVKPEHTKALTNRLGDENYNILEEAYALLEKRPQLFNLAPNELIEWLTDDRNNEKQQGALKFIAQKPELLKPEHTEALTNLLGDENDFVRRAAFTLLEKRPQLFNLEGIPFTQWLSDEENWGTRHAVLRLIAQKPELVKPEHTEALTNCLSDKDNSVLKATYALLEKRPQLFNLAPNELTEWLTDDRSQEKQQGALKLIAHKPGLVKPEHTEALTNLLGDKNDFVRGAAFTLMEKQPQLFNFASIPLTEWLTDERSWGKLRGALGLIARKPELVKPEHVDALSLRFLNAIIDSKSIANEPWSYIHLLWSYIHLVGQQSLLALMPFIEAGYEQPHLRPQLRFIVLLLGGGTDQVTDSLKWFGSKKKDFVYDTAPAAETLNLFATLWPWTSGYQDSRSHLKDHINFLIAVHEHDWQLSNLGDLRIIQKYFETAKIPTDTVDQAIYAITADSWLYKTLKVFGSHLLFWIVLIALYPRFPLVQATFFWNPQVRKFVGLGYVGLLLTYIPFLRHILFSPFRASLLSDAYLSDFAASAYYPNSLVSKGDQKNGEAIPIVEAIPRLKGQIVLIADSGLGKTLFLKYLLSINHRVTVFLPATKCKNGVLEAVQAKLHGFAQEPEYLKTLIYAGAIDICIDGINEVSPDTRESIRSFAENFFKGNIIITSQPFEWKPPSTAERWYLQPLTDDQIEEFLLTRPVDAKKAPIAKEHYEAACREFLKSALHKNKIEEASINRRILSNPMDATIVASMLASNESPDLFHLQEQQYRMMAKDYEIKMLMAFPLKKFSEQVYQMRINDLFIIPYEPFEREIGEMEAHKMVLVRQYQDGSEIKKEAFFRHDKIMDYFIVQVFLGENNDRPSEHFRDPRFRGVYFLLAQLLPLEEAQALREKLIQYAADTKDHSISDDFIKLLRSRSEQAVNFNSVR